MARTAHSKSAPATTTTDAVTKSGKEKPLAQLDPRIGEYVQRAREVAKLSDILNKRFSAFVQIRQQYAAAKSETRPDKAIFATWLEADNAIAETWGALSGLHDAIISPSPPSGFEKVAASLAGVVSAIKSIYQTDCIYTISLSPLRTANRRLDATISELVKRLFHSVPSALPDDENSDDKSSVDDLRTRCIDRILAVAAQYGVVVDVCGTTDWKQVFSVLQAQEPDAPEWRHLNEDSDKLRIGHACWFYLERKARELEDAKADKNHQKLVAAIVAAMPAVAPADVDAALSKLQSDAEREADMICRLQEVCLPGDASNYKAAAKIALSKTKWKRAKDRLREISILLDYRIDATAEQIGAALEPPVKRQTVVRTKFWSDLIVKRNRDKEDTKHGKWAAGAHQPRQNGKTMSAR